MQTAGNYSILPSEIVKTRVQHRLKEKFKGKSPSEAFAWSKLELVGEGSEEGRME